jgi:hypothetical protein
MGIILKLNLKKSGWGGSEFILLKKGTSAGSCEYGNELLVLMKGGKFLD